MAKDTKLEPVTVESMVEEAVETITEDEQEEALWAVRRFHNPGAATLNNNNHVQLAARQTHFTWANNNSSMDAEEKEP